jgi:NitT/TauT family transport system permease protein
VSTSAATKLEELGEEPQAAEAEVTQPRRWGSSALVLALQLAIVAALLAAWQWLPQVDAFRERSHIFDPFFISSPSAVAERLYALSFGDQSATPLWSYTWNTLSAALAGLAIGMVGGGALGLLLGSVRSLARVFRPFVVAANATPRIALIPIVVLLFGPTFTGSVMISVMVTFFVAFFNAYEGARSVPPTLIQNATTLGASRLQVMLRVRLPFVVAWTLAALPLAATFSVIGVVTGEILIGSEGLGRLLETATATVDASLTFSVVIILATLGLATVLVADQVTKRILHWWDK